MVDDLVGFQIRLRVRLAHVWHGFRSRLQAMRQKCGLAMKWGWSACCERISQAGMCMIYRPQIESYDGRIA